MKRRHFIQGSTGSAFAAMASAPNLLASEKEAIFDVHQHVNFHGRANDVLVEHQRKMGVSKTVLLPSGGQFSLASTHKGKSNGLAARVFGTEAAARLASKYPKELVYFCNEIPDLKDAQKSLEAWLKRGACGIGEQKFALDCDSKPMQLIYEVASEFEVPVLIHFQHGKYNTAFERLPAMLKKYPKVNFIGHAQTFWGNIDAKHIQKDLYPKTKVTAGGLTDKYLADYPNIFGDLSAGSGQNSMTRDEDHAAGFLDRHQNKLLLGTDCADPATGPKCSGEGTISLVRKLVPDAKARSKIFSGNAKRIIKFG